MQPNDYPIEFTAHLERHLQNLAHQEHQAARVAARDGDDTLGHGHAEAAFAYACSAAEVNQVAQAIIAHLDRLAAKEAKAQDGSHVWPIIGLDNLDERLDSPRPNNAQLQWPRWGIPVEGTTADPYLGVSASTRGNGTEEILLFVHDVFDTTGDDHRHGHMLNVDINRWRALNQLVERIAAGKPTPYNADGAVQVAVDQK